MTKQEEFWKQFCQSKNEDEEAINYIRVKWNLN